MNYFLKTLVFLTLIWTQAFAQKYTISGYMEALESGEKLIAANIFDTASATGTSTNTYGFYSLTLAAADSVRLRFSYIGYEPQQITIALDKNTSLNIQLSESVSLETVEVTSERIDRIEQRTQMSQVDIPVEQIKKLPALLGEVDVLKTLQLLPGVQAGGEGQSGFYVRGGSPDQNLILLDGVPIYNASHVLGIFSVFNADAIKNVTLTKGGFPARYGGRLSSVVEVNMKEGNLYEWHGEGSIGLISSKLTLEGPIIKGKTSVLVSGRRTYADLIVRPFIKAANRRNEENNAAPRAFFYDLNAKVQHKFNDKHRLFLSGYSGADILDISVEEEQETFSGGPNWDNKIAALRWNWQLSNRLFSNTTFTYSRYTFNLETNYEDRVSDPPTKFFRLYHSGIEDWSGRIDFDFIPTPEHYIRFGAAATNHLYKPGALTSQNEAAGLRLDTIVGSQNIRAWEYAAYIEDDFQLGALKANVGLHASAFRVDEQWYTSLQPRLGLRYLLPNQLALKASFSTMTQYINLLTSEALSLPTDLWVPSTERVKPQQAWQLALGAARTFWDKYEFSVEGFYKKMDNVISFKEGASFLAGLNSDWQEKVTQGKGEAYGAEFFLQKKKGKTTGWIAYTLSWNWRQFDEINGGRRYPFRYDRRHDISVVVSHEFTNRISASVAWVYGTGNAFTAAQYRYQYEAPFIWEFEGPDGMESTNIFEREIEVTGTKNSFRMSNYHRLDASIDFTKKKKRYERRWTLGAYNIYNHINPYFVFVGNEDKNGTNERVLKEVGILPVIPTVSYAVKF